MGDGLAAWATPVADWLVTYGLHSTVALTSVWLVERSGRIRAPLTRDVLWKSALLIGFLTASWRIAGGPAHGPEAALREGLGPGGLHPAAFEEIRQHVLRPIPLAERPVPESGRLSVAAHLRDPSAACLGALRSMRSLDPAGVESLRQICGATGWRSKLPGILLMMWVGGGGLLLLAAGRRRLGVRRLLERRERITGGQARHLLDRLIAREGMGGEVALYWVAGLESPAVIGPRAIGLPARIEELNSEQLAAALGHELAHLARRDRQWMGAARVLAAIGFVQPLNRLALRRLEETAELLADDWAVRRTGDPLGLAGALATVAGWVSGSRATPALSMASGRSQLGHRVERLLSAEDRVRTSRGVLVLACAALCLLISAIPGLSVPAGSSIRVDSDPPVDLATAAPTGREGHRVRIVIEQVDR